MANGPYNHRRRRNEWGRNATLELIVTALVFVMVVGLLGVFLFVYHDIPFRLSSP